MTSPSRDGDAAPGPGSAGLEGQASLIRYPAELSVKAMGLDAELDGLGFRALVKSLVLPLLDPQLPGCAPRPVKVDTRDSSGGKYLSVRVHFTASSQGQLEAIYAALHAEPRVLFTL